MGLDLKWFTDTVPGALVAFSTGIAALIAAVTKVSTAIEDWKRSKRAKSVPPVQHTNPFPVAPSTDPALIAHMQIDMLRTTLKQAEWHMSDLRDELAEMRRNMEDVARDQRQTAGALQAAQLKLDAANAKVATLEAALLECQANALQRQRERDAADARALAATRELARCKREAGSSNSTTDGGLVTPLRPPRGAK
jgi:small-conductance mechanosensitive channel